MSTEEIVVLTIFLTLCFIFLMLCIYRAFVEVRKAELEKLEQKEIKEINEILAFLAEIRQVVREEINAQNKKSHTERTE